MTFIHYIIDLCVCVLFAFVCGYISQEISIVFFLFFYVYQLYTLFSSEIQNKTFRIISFNVLFFLMYTLVTYLIPVFYLLGLSDSIVAVVVYDESYLSTSLLLSAVSVESYMYGYLKSLNGTHKFNSDMIFSTIAKKRFLLNLCAIVGCVVFIFDYLKSRSQGLVDISGSTTTIVNCCMIMPMAIVGFLNKSDHLGVLAFLWRNRIIFSVVFFVILSLLLMGDRMTPLCLMCTMTFVINEFVYQFSIKQFIVGTLLGASLLFLISYTRHSDAGVNISHGITEFRTHENNKAVFFQDIFPINADLILGSEIHEKEGLFKPFRFVPLVCAPIPFLPNYIKKEFFDNDINTGLKLTTYNRDRLNFNYESDIGIHCVVDIFMSWGWLGSILIFLLFGTVVSRITNNICNLFGVICYTGLISWSVYMARETLFNPYRDIVWMLIMAKFIINKPLKH